MLLPPPAKINETDNFGEGDHDDDIQFDFTNDAGAKSGAAASECESSSEVDDSDCD